MASTAILCLLVGLLSPALAYTIPSRTEQPMREHSRMGYMRPIMSRGPVIPVPVAPTYQAYYNNYYNRQPTPPPPKPKSELFQPPAGMGSGSTVIGTGSTGRSGLSYINNLLSGVNKKIYGPSSTGSGGPPSTPFEPPTDINGRWPTPNPTGGVGTGWETPGVNTGTGFGTPGVVTGPGGFGSPGGSPGIGSPGVNSGFGSQTGPGFGGVAPAGSGPGSFPAGPGGSPTDIFGPGLAPVALDIPDPTNSPVTDTGSPDPTPSTGIIINNGPNEPPASLFPAGPTNSGTAQPQQPPQQPAQPPQQPTQAQPGSGDPQLPFMDQLDGPWVWPDLVVTGPLPSAQFGASSSGGSQPNSQPPIQASTQEVQGQTLQQAQGVTSFLERGRSAQNLPPEPVEVQQQLDLSPTEPQPAQPTEVLEPAVLLQAEPAGVVEQPAEPVQVVLQQAERVRSFLERGRAAQTLPPEPAAAEQLDLSQIEPQSVQTPRVVLQQAEAVPSVIQPVVVVEPQFRTVTFQPTPETDPAQP